MTAIAMAALRPTVEHFEFKTNLSVAQQSLAAFRYAIVIYCADVQTVPHEFYRNIPDKNSPPSQDRDSLPNEKPEPKPVPTISLGEALVAAKKIERVAFPLGKKGQPFENGDPGSLQVYEPQIWAVSLPSLAKYFKKPELFASARSSQVAILVVPFLTTKEAEGIQNIIGNLSEQREGKPVYRGDCFFTRSSMEGMFNGWIYLSDL